MCSLITENHVSWCSGRRHLAARDSQGFWNTNRQQILNASRPKHLHVNPREDEDLFKGVMVSFPST